ncbi:MAG: ATP synthase F0 subunit C [Polyangia bacterium]
MSAFFVTMLVAGAAFAQDAASVGIQYAERDKWIAVAGALGVAIAAFGGALGQGKAAAAALDGIARNPSAADKIFTPMIIGLALIESLVIYALVTFFILNGKIH